VDTKVIKKRPPDPRSLERAQALVGRIVAERHDRPSLVSHIACEVGGEIIEGIRPPGADLNSVELSKRYKTSRTPIREALMLLEKEGLVDVPPRKRPRVASPKIAEIREIYRARSVLFGMIASEVARNITAEELDRLRQPFHEMERAYERDDLNAFIWANVDFYELNTQLAKNRTVKRMLDSLLLRTARLRRISLSRPGRMARSFDDHARLLKAYEDRDEQLAAALIRSNHINALAALETYFAEGDIDEASVPVRRRRRRAAG